MKKRIVKQIIFPLLASLIWGLAFVAQSVGAEYIEPFTFNALRGVIAVLTLSVMLAVTELIKQKKGIVTKPAGSRKDLIIGGICCGTVMAVATNIQQIGLKGTDAGKASFITALYIVLVPIMGLLFHRRVSLPTVISVCISVAGLYLLCVGDGFSIQSSDIYLIICAFCFSVHILVIDHFAPLTNEIALSLVQFIVMSAESSVMALIFEHPSIEGITACIGQLLYVGIFSSGIAYTLQIIAQKGSDPTIVSLLLSMESVFGAIGGAIILHEIMTPREYFGCFLMLCAVVLSQMPMQIWRKVFRKRKRNENTKK